MSDELTPEQKFAQQDPEILVLRELARGRSRDEIVAQFVKNDWAPEAAEARVGRIADEFQRYTASPESRAEFVAEKEKMRKLGMKALLGGVAFVLLGYFSGSMMNVYLGGALACLGLVGMIVPSRQLRRCRKYSESPSYPRAEQDT